MYYLLSPSELLGRTTGFLNSVAKLICPLGEVKYKVGVTKHKIACFLPYAHVNESKRLFEGYKGESMKKKGRQGRITKMSKASTMKCMKMSHWKQLFGTQSKNN